MKMNSTIKMALGTVMSLAMLPFFNKANAQETKKDFNRDVPMSQKTYVNYANSYGQRKNVGAYEFANLMNYFKNHTSSTPVMQEVKLAKNDTAAFRYGFLDLKTLNDDMKKKNQPESVVQIGGLMKDKKDKPVFLKVSANELDRLVTEMDKKSGIENLAYAVEVSDQETHASKVGTAVDFTTHDLCTVPTNVVVYRGLRSAAEIQLGTLNQGTPKSYEEGQIQEQAVEARKALVTDLAQKLDNHNLEDIFLDQFYKLPADVRKDMDKALAKRVERLDPMNPRDITKAEVSELGKVLVQNDSDQKLEDKKNKKPEQPDGETIRFLKENTRQFSVDFINENKLDIQQKGPVNITSPRAKPKTNTP